MLKNILFVLIYCLPIFGLAQPKSAETYRKVYATSYQEALAYVKEQQATIRQVLNLNPPQTAVILAAAFPELVRYSEVQNLIETASLEMLYVRLGHNYANFSVGRFQMKPSFLEALETYAKQRDWKAFASLYRYDNTHSEQAIRKKRVERLRSTEWQLRYLNCFAFIVWQRFPQLAQAPPERQVRFLAAAYNRGFLQSYEEIERWTKIAAFPYGEAYKNASQYCYSEIAWDFYLHEGQSWFVR